MGGISRCDAVGVARRDDDPRRRADVDRVSHGGDRHHPYRRVAPACGGRGARDPGRGGVAIAAHPVFGARAGFDAAALGAIDGFEAAHPAQHEWPKAARELAEFREVAFAARPSIAAIGSTDFHATAPLGLCRTFLFVTDVSERGVLDAIRAGRTVACDGDGKTYGSPALSAAVAEACARAAGSPARDANAIGSIGALLVWLGCIGLAAAGVSERDLE